LYGKESAQWSVRPSDRIAARLRGIRLRTVADLGCGDGRLRDAVAPLSVVSVDHCAAKDGIIAADIAQTGLDPRSVDAVVFSLALIGKNWRDYLVEANRILRLGGFLFIAEPQRRAGQDASRLIDAVRDRGFGIQGEVIHEERIVYVTAVKQREEEGQKDGK
jgi:ribosomal RNA-processing protein 8